MPADAGVIEYEMGYAADEFGNVLQGPFSGDKSPYSCETIAPHHWRVSHKDTSRSLEIQVLEKPPRRLGLFALPVLQVQFDLHDGDDQFKTGFFDRFHKYFHKGGG